MKKGVSFKKGMSLYELLIVIAIIGILVMVVTISMRDFLPSWKLANNAKIISTKLRQAQEDAVTTQKQHLIRFTTGTQPVFLQLIKIDVAEVEIQKLYLDQNISVTLDPSFTNSQITFSADGGPSTSGNIVVNLNDASKTINISPAGTIKLND